MAGPFVAMGDEPVGVATVEANCGRKKTKFPLT